MKENQSSVRSKEWLLDALLDLMQTKPFDEIAVKEIAETAQLDRRTFYRHFKSKEDILKYGIAKGVRDYHILHQENGINGIRDIAYAFFCVCEKYKDFFLLLHRQNLNHLFLTELNHIFPEMHLRYHSREEQQLPYFRSAYRLAYHIGGFWNIMNEWLEHGARRSPEELTEIVLAVFSLTNPSCSSNLGYI
ncbi:MAG: TetR/AcrR family transcriptional regulator [Lachnospiraceae bacterium]